MAYRFNGTGDRVEFAIAPFSSYTFGAATFASLFKRTTLAVNHFLIWMTDANGSTNRVGYYVNTSNIPQIFLNGTAPANAISLPSATIWYLLAVTWTAASTTPRVHLFNGTSWTHADADSAVGSSFTPDGSSRLAFGARPDGVLPFAGDAVCAGIKKANSTDLQIETLTATAFQSWRSFGFDWLIGFDASLESAGILQDQATPGTGDEIAITGTTPVSDPPGWAWITALAPVADFTGTPLSGAVPLSVAFTDTSTNTPTSWLWNFGDGTTSTSQNPTHSFAAGGTYTVVLTATNASGSNAKTRTGYVTATETIAYVAGGGVTIW